MPKGLQVALTGAVGQVHKFMDDGSIVIGSGSAGQGVDNKSATFFESARTGDIQVYGNLTASSHVSASFFYGDGSNLTGINSVDVTDSTANTAFPVVFHNESTTGLHDDTGAFTYNPSTGEAVITKVTTPTIDVSSAGAMNIGATVGANNLTLGASNSTVVVAGNLTVNGTTTTVNSTTLTFDDKNIELAHSPDGSEGDDSAVDGGGITLKSSDSDKTLNWVNSTDSWTSSEHLDLASGKEFKINGTSVLTAAGAAKVQDAVAGNGLAASSGVLSVGVDDSSIELNSDALRVKAGGIATSMLAADAVTGAKIADDSIDSEHLVDGGIDTAHLANDAVTPAKMSIFDDSLAATDTHIMIADGTDYSSFAMSGDATLSNAGVLTIAAGAVENSMLAGSIANAKLANSSVTLTAGAGLAAMGAVSLGGSVTVAVDGVLEDLDTLGAASSDGEMIVATGAGTFAYESGATLRTSIGVGTGDTVQVTNLTASTHVSASTIYANNFNVANLSGAIDGNLVLASDADIVYKIDCDGDGTNNYTFQTGEESIAEMDESGNLQISGGLSASLGVSASTLHLDSVLVTATATELNYVDGVTSAIQTQLDGKSPTAGNTSLVTVGTISTGTWNGTAIATDYIAADAITAAKIADDVVNSEHLAAGSIDTEHIADSQVTTAKIAADAITGAKLADDSVDSEHLVDGGIDTAHLAADAVTGAKIADDAIDSEHLAAGSIDTEHIAAGQVTNAKLAGSITIDKIEATDLTLKAESFADDDGQIPTTAAVKQYVDSVAQGLSAKDSVRAATTANGTLSSAYANGQTVDGVTLATGDRILIKNQTAGEENGIYTVNASGAPTRATDFDLAAEVEAGAYFFVEEGTTNADAGFVLTTDGSITVGTTSLSFTQFSGLGSITAGAAMSKTGNQLDVEVDDSSIEVSSDALRVKASGITNAMLAGSITASKMNNAIFEDLESLGAASSDGEMIVATGAGAFAYESGATLRTSIGVGTGDSPQLTGLELGHASDTTITRASSGDIAVEGNVVYRAGGTDVPLTDGGTGASTASAARTNLGLAIGSDVQAYDAQLADIAGLAVTDGGIIVGDGSNFVLETGATARASLGLTIGTNVQAYDAELTELATMASNTAAALADLTNTEVAFLDGATAGTAVASKAAVYGTGKELAADNFRCKRYTDSTELNNLATSMSGGALDGMIFFVQTAPTSGTAFDKGVTENNKFYFVEGNQAFPSPFLSS